MEEPRIAAKVTSPALREPLSSDLTDGPNSKAQLHFEKGQGSRTGRPELHPMRPRELKTGALQELDVAVLFPSPKFVCNRLAHFFANDCTSKALEMHCLAKLW